MPDQRIVQKLKKFKPVLYCTVEVDGGLVPCIDMHLACHLRHKMLEKMQDKDTVSTLK